MSKTVPNFLFPTNFRNGKNIKRLIKDFNVQGYGIAVYLLETLAETEGHQYPISDIDLIADEMKVSIPVINTVITSYGLFEIVEREDGKQFISSQLNKWLEPYYTKVEKLSRAGKISALKKKQAQEKQLRELSELDSSQHMLNICPTINKLINKSINKSINKKDGDEESEKFEKLNEMLLNAQVAKDKKNKQLENLSQANLQNQILDKY
ncbi:Lin1244/Lin1753 domain-containing protein [Aliarcobacter skirrowii]|uniref:Lin1244/Lin1753 domain-containing protein n=1 Tax=Aliarcobacter skirrowii TaxID=28200 RepID=UPI000834A8FA|nr:Lin1244/Lin1753 domain-containing protein [Aliarcobacter skirrowii]